MHNVPEYRIRERFDGTESHNPLSVLGDLCLKLIDEQHLSWAEFRDACDSLRNSRSRDIQCSGFSIRLLYNPGRSTNTLAAVTPDKVSERPCFLCTDNLPAKQMAVLYRDEFLILANPRPVVPLHLTIAHRTHRPQSIFESIDLFLRITEDIGPGFSTLYNGPRCGASAPDHLHFQAVPSGNMPIEKELDTRDKFSVLRSTGSTTISSGRGLGRMVAVIEGSDPQDVRLAFQDSVDALHKDTMAGGEPMINVIGHCSHGKLRLAVFPRRAHRPAAFFFEDDRRIMVSPAVMEMGGIIVTPSETDFNRLDASAIEEMYREVSLMP